MNVTQPGRLFFYFILLFYIKNVCNMHYTHIYYNIIISDYSDVGRGCIILVYIPYKLYV